jgi:hypothetical protein
VEEDEAAEEVNTMTMAIQVVSVMIWPSNKTKVKSDLESDAATQKYKRV